MHCWIWLRDEVSVRCWSLLLQISSCFRWSIWQDRDKELATSTLLVFTSTHTLEKYWFSCFFHNKRKCTRLDSCIRAKESLLTPKSFWRWSLPTTRTDVLRHTCSLYINRFYTLLENIPYLLQVTVQASPARRGEQKEEKGSWPNKNSPLHQEDKPYRILSEKDRNKKKTFTCPNLSVA